MLTCTSLPSCSYELILSNVFSYARFVDRDTLMRHYGGGIGHFNNASLSDDDNHDKNMDIDDSDNSESEVGEFLDDLTPASRHSVENSSNNLESDNEEGSLSSSSSESDRDSDLDVDDSDSDLGSDFYVSF